MANWFEEQHLGANYTETWQVDSQTVPSEARRIYPAPVYDANGDLRCRSCGGVVSRSVGGTGHGFASCSDVGCPNHGFEFLEGSVLTNPSRTR